MISCAVTVDFFGMSKIAKEKFLRQTMDKCENQDGLQEISALLYRSG